MRTLLLHYYGYACFIVTLLWLCALCCHIIITVHILYVVSARLMNTILSDYRFSYSVVLVSYCQSFFAVQHCSQFYILLLFHTGEYFRKFLLPSLFFLEIQLIRSLYTVANSICRQCMVGFFSFPIIKGWFGNS